MTSEFKRNEKNSLTGSEGSGAHANGRLESERAPAQVVSPEEPDEDKSETPPLARPDDTLGSADVSGSGLPRGGTI